MSQAMQTQQQRFEIVPSEVVAVDGERPAPDRVAASADHVVELVVSGPEPIACRLIQIDGQVAVLRRFAPNATSNPDSRLFTHCKNGVLLRTRRLDVRFDNAGKREWKGRCLLHVDSVQAVLGRGDGRDEARVGGLSLADIEDGAYLESESA